MPGQDQSEGPSFAEFYQSDDNPDKALPASKTSFAMGSAAVGAALSALPNSLFGYALSTNKKEEYAHTISEMAHSESFINEFSERIGTPGESESEEAFVKRAKSILRELLRSRLRNW